MTHQLPVTLVTKDASQDPLTDDDYRAIITGLREINGWSYQRLADEAGHNGKAWWQAVEKGNRAIDEQGRNALRRLTDGELPPQPPSVTSVTDAYIHHDAAMYVIGALPVGERVRRVLMLADGDVAIYANGDIHAEPLQAVLGGFVTKDIQTGARGNVTDVTPIAPILRGNQNARSARKYYRPALPPELRERVEASGVDVATLIEAGLAALSAEVEG